MLKIKVTINVNSLTLSKREKKCTKYGIEQSLNSDRETAPAHCLPKLLNRENLTRLNAVFLVHYNGRAVVSPGAWQCVHINRCQKKTFCSTLECHWSKIYFLNNSEEISFYRVLLICVIK